MAPELSPSDTFVTYKKLLHVKLQSQNYPHAEGESHSIFLHTAVQSPDPKHSIYIPPAPKGMVLVLQPPHAGKGSESLGYFTLLGKRRLGCGLMKISLPLQSSPLRGARSLWPS